MVPHCIDGSRDSGRRPSPQGRAPVSRAERVRVASPRGAPSVRANSALTQPSIHSGGILLKSLNRSIINPSVSLVVPLLLSLRAVARAPLLVLLLYPVPGTASTLARPVARCRGGTAALLHSTTRSCQSKFSGAWPSFRRVSQRISSVAAVRSLLATSSPRPTTIHHHHHHHHHRHRCRHHRHHHHHHHHASVCLQQRPADFFSPILI